MSVRKALLPVAEQLRALSGPSVFDIRTTGLIVRKRTWVGGRVGMAGGHTDEDLELPRHYRARHVTVRELAASGGLLQMGDVRFGPVTPAFEGGGYTPEQLNPEGSTGVEIIHVLTGAMAGEYRLIALESDRPFRYELLLRRMRTTP